MERHWESVRGDEWWYSDHLIETGGFPDDTTSPPIFFIEITVADRPAFTPGLLLYFLRRTQSKFPEHQLWCALNSAVEPLMKQLAADNRIVFQTIMPSNSAVARILKIECDREC